MSNISDFQNGFRTGTTAGKPAPPGKDRGAGTYNPGGGYLRSCIKKG